MKKIGVFASLFILCVLPLAGKAAAYWMEIIGPGKLNEPVRIQICYGNIDEYSIRHRDTGIELTRTGDFKIMVMNPGGRTTAISLGQKADCWEGTFTPDHEGVYRILGLNDGHPVVDRSKTGGKNVRPVDLLCGTYIIGNFTPDVKPAQLLDIVVVMKNGIANVTAFNNKTTAAKGTTLRVFNPENWEKELTVNEKGEAIFKPTMKGLYIIREDHDDGTPGVYKGVSYSSTRYRCNYCLLVQ